MMESNRKDKPPFSQVSSGITPNSLNLQAFDTMADHMVQQTMVTPTGVVYIHSLILIPSNIGNETNYYTCTIVSFLYHLILGMRLTNYYTCTIVSFLYHLILGMRLTNYCTVYTCTIVSFLYHLILGMRLTISV